MDARRAAGIVAYTLLLPPPLPLHDVDVAVALVTRCVIVVVIVDMTRAASLRMRWRARGGVLRRLVSFALFQLRGDVSVSRAPTC